MNQRIVSSTCTQLTATSHTIYSGSIDCAVQVSLKSLTKNYKRSRKWNFSKKYFQTVRNEGFAALYKGFIPTWVRMVKTFELLDLMHVIITIFLFSRVLGT